MQGRKPIIGLCGGIGAGKSRVAAEFAARGCLVIDSDRLNHEVLARPEVLGQLRAWWGDVVVATDGGPDRQRIAEIVFADAGKRRRLEQLVYPLIAQRRADMITRVQDNSAISAIVLDSPLLLESNLDRECDWIVFVAASAARRQQRLRDGRGWGVAEIRRRQRWQRSTAEKQARADFIVNNDGPPEALGSQIQGILQTILTRQSDPRAELAGLELPRSRVRTGMPHPGWWGLRKPARERIATGGPRTEMAGRASCPREF